MIGCLRTRIRKQPIIELYFQREAVLKFYYLEARRKWQIMEQIKLLVEQSFTKRSYCNYNEPKF